MLRLVGVAEARLSMPLAPLKPIRLFKIWAETVLPMGKPLSRMPLPGLRMMAGSVKLVAEAPITLPVMTMPLVAAAVTRMLAPLRLPAVLPKPKILSPRTDCPVFSRLRPTSEPVWPGVPRSCTSGPLTVPRATSSAVPATPSAPVPSFTSSALPAMPSAPAPAPRVVLFVLPKFSVCVVPSMLVSAAVRAGSAEAGTITATPLVSCATGIIKMLFSRPATGLSPPSELASWFSRPLGRALALAMNCRNEP